MGCLGFCLLSAGGFFWKGQVLEGLICLGTLALVTLPPALEACCRWKLRRGFFVFCLFYALGPMLGKAYRLYYLTHWWDKLLHTSAGFVFGVLGICLCRALNHGKETSLALEVVFGICFSVAVSAVWELVEFGVDRCFGADMQNDTVVYAIHSYLLGDAPGVLGSITDIGQVHVDGTPLGVAGYLDIGLIDTMQDVLVETVGAVVYGAYHGCSGGKKPLVQMVNTGK